ncbi:hypothetical protein Ahy_B03g064278 [Arachis hypogaea]|uniref:F-box associated domain-containing protein n=1 Tax=Arachis hypogaea TaxID=3818 RepID=A0A444ZZA1_ARAHY|nr:hypothetical protein Ahy_B03g064278 [Arachis hypogaea]
MSDITPRRVTIPQLNEDLLWKIFVRCDAKTVGRSRTTSKEWRFKLSTALFVKQHFKQNKNRDRSVIIEVGYPPSDESCRWFLKAMLDGGQQMNMNVPIPINRFGFYSLIGLDNGNVCIRFSQGGLSARLMIWNLLTRRMMFVSDQASKHCRHAVSLYAFGYLVDGIEYRIIHVYKCAYSTKQMSWTLYNSFEADCNRSGKFNTEVQKLGPKHVVNNIIVYWIGWGGDDFMKPKLIFTFSLQQRLFYEGKVPDKVKSAYHSFTLFKDGIGFISYKNTDFSREIVVWGINRDSDNKLYWDKMIRISGVGIPYNPTLFVGKDIISVLDSSCYFGSANDSEITEVILSRLKYRGRLWEHLFQHNWHETVYVKTVTMHCQGLYLV